MSTVNNPIVSTVTIYVKSFVKNAATIIRILDRQLINTFCIVYLLTWKDIRKEMFRYLRSILQKVYKNNRPVTIFAETPKINEEVTSPKNSNTTILDTA